MQHDFGSTRVECLTITSPAIGVELESMHLPTATGEARAVGTLTITATIVVGTFIDVCSIKNNNIMMTDYVYLVCEYAHVNVFTYYVMWRVSPLQPRPSELG